MRVGTWTLGTRRPSAMAEERHHHGKDQESDLAQNRHREVEEASLDQEVGGRPIDRRQARDRESGSASLPVAPRRLKLRTEMGVHR